MTDTITIPQVTDSGAVRGMMYALRGRYRFLDTIPIGLSVLGREIFGLLLGGGNGPEKVLFAAAFHGQEWLTALTVLRLCENICEAMQKDGKLDDLDLRQALAGRQPHSGAHGQPRRGGHRPAGRRGRRPLCRAGRRPGGRPAGLWQANARGVDINHNFNAGWALLQELERKKGIDGPAPRQWGGPCPESEPETRALTGLCARFRFRHVVALHSQGEEIYWRYGDRTPPQAQMMADVLGAASGYRVADPEGLASHGGFKDWFIDSTGRPGFTIELGQGVNPLPGFRLRIAVRQGPGNAAAGRSFIAKCVYLYKKIQIV